MQCHQHVWASQTTSPFLWATSSKLATFHDISNSRDIQSTLSPTPSFPSSYIWSSLIFHHSTTPTSSQIIPHQQRLLACLSCCLECLISPSKRSTIPGALQKSPENPPLQDTNMKLMKTQGASDAMQMAHYKLTIIIIIIIISTSMQKQLSAYLQLVLKYL